jgi:hypothetical protein
MLFGSILARREHRRFTSRLLDDLHGNSKHVVEEAYSTSENIIGIVAGTGIAVIFACYLWLKLDVFARSPPRPEANAQNSGLFHEVIISYFSQTLTATNCIW